MRTNIFRTTYEQPENKLTYCFLSLLEHLDIGLAAQLVSGSGLPVNSYERLHVELLYGGGKGNPDGSFTFEGQGIPLTIFLENKTWRRQIDMEQVKRHIREHLSDSDHRRLLVITTDHDHKDRLSSLRDSRVHFMTWHQIAESAERLSHNAAESKDQLLLSEFQEYLETSGEAWRARMPDLKLLEAHAQYLKIANDEDRFLKECQRLMDALRDVGAAFQDQIIEVETERPRYGRVGNECSLRSAPFGQWIFFGVYFDEGDHKIPFKVPLQAEFAIFFDMQPRSRDQLAKLPKLKEAISDLMKCGFEFNFPENKCGNAWRVCFWREPMNRHVGTSLNELRTMFETQLRVLLASDFYRISCSHPE